VNKLLLVPLGAFLLSGCSILGPYPVRHTDSVDASVDALKAGAQQSTITIPPMPGVFPALVESAAIEEQVAVVTEPPAEALAEIPEEVRFDIQVEDVSAGEFFRGLVTDTSFNMVVHPDVKGAVSLTLTDVTVPDVMAIMRDVYGYDSTLRGNVYQVYPDVLRTEIYHLNYLNVSRKGRSETQVSAGKVSDSNNNSNNSNNGNSNGYNGSSESGNSGRSQQVVGTIVNTSADADLWSEVGLTLESLVSGDNGSQVFVTPQVGLVVVKAKPRTLRAVADYLNLVENTLTRQVVLEAKIVEVTLNEGFQAGIDWHTFGDASGGTFDGQTLLFPDGSIGTTPGSEHRVAGEFTSNNLEVFNPLGGNFTLSTAFGDFDATINLLRTQGTVQVLSSPRIATVNNQKAVIKVGSDEFFVTDISSNTVTAGSAINTNDSPELTPFFSGIALDVTPQISSSGEVILHVHPTVSEVTEQRKEIGGELVPLAASTIRESDSIVKAQSGQIIVIGGLMQNSSRDNNAAVPWLSQIPGFGNLFKQKAQSGIKSELVILLKPMVIDNAGQNQLMQESADRTSDLRAQMKVRG
jgi:MSHA biogenesis protein MshL